MNNFKGSLHNRHSAIITKEMIDEFIDEAVCFLDINQGNDLVQYDKLIGKTIFAEDGVVSEDSLRSIAENFPTDQIDVYEETKNILLKAMNYVGNQINNMSEDPRYIRDQSEFEN